MKIAGYTAMTAAEFQNMGQLPAGVAWMACHFSCYGVGLTNLPTRLPENAMVIVNDRTPVQGHDKVTVVRQLCELYEALKPGYILLDLERPQNPETQEIAEEIVKALPCPVGVSQLYAKDLNCPVFLPPPAIDCPLKDHLQPWHGREIWLEMATDAQTATVTEDCCHFAPAPVAPLEEPLFDSEVFCHYRAEYKEDAAVVHLLRDQAALQEMLRSAEGFGVTLAVGLYQELGAEFF